LGVVRQDAVRHGEAGLGRARFGKGEKNEDDEISIDGGEPHYDAERSTLAESA
jgi:hypothetical protein